MLVSRLKKLRPLTIALTLSVTMPLMAAESSNANSVEDLAYGSALYNLFQNNNLKAITNINVAIEQNTLKTKPEDAELLLGGLYFEYGLIDEAEEILTRLLDANTSTHTKDKIWFNLARVQYQKNKYSNAEDLLNRITDSLSPRWLSQKDYLLTSIYIKNKDFKKASVSASHITSNSAWAAYAEYNLGVSLNSNKQEELSHQWLLKLIDRSTSKKDLELRSLQNSARLAYGITSLRQNKFETAIEMLGSIDTSSPLTNKALLATGWAWSRLSEPAKALTYWVTLTEQNEDDGATQEAYLATAFAYEQLKNRPLAIRYYEQAIKKLKLTDIKLGKAIDSINQMDLINTLYRDNIIKPNLRTFFNKALSKNISTSFLHQMFAEKTFQKAVLNYQELLEIEGLLIQWRKDIPALDLMLSERIKTFQNKRRQIKKATSFSELEEIQRQRDVLAKEVNRIEQDEDYYALAKDDEVGYLQQLSLAKGLIKKLKPGQNMDSESEKARIMSGLLQWNISTDYPRRRWKLVHQLQMLDRALEKAHLSSVSLKKSSARNVRKLNEFSQRIKGQEKEVTRLENNTTRLIDEQEQYINKLAIRTIERRKRHLAQLDLSTRYSLTRLYDEVLQAQSPQAQQKTVKPEADSNKATQQEKVVETIDSPTKPEIEIEAAKKPALQQQEEQPEQQQPITEPVVEIKPNTEQTLAEPQQQQTVAEPTIESNPETEQTLEPKAPPEPVKPLKATPTEAEASHE